MDDALTIPAPPANTLVTARTDGERGGRTGRAAGSLTVTQRLGAGLLSLASSLSAILTMT